MTYKTFLFIVVLMWACGQKPTENPTVDTGNPVHLEKSEPAKEVVSMDSLVDFYEAADLDVARVYMDLRDTSVYDLIDRECVITVFPDTLWLNEQQKDEDTWAVVVDDHTYYESIALDTLSKQGIPILNSDYNRDKKYLLFELDGDSTYVIDRRKMKDAWGLILFNGKSKPVWWMSTDVNEGLKVVYGR